MDEHKAPIIIKRVRKGGAAVHNGGAWKVAYADFVTAMMALFIVLWLLNSNAEVQKAVGGYFRDPTGSGKKAGTAVAGSGESLSVEKEDLNDLKQKIEQALKQLPEMSKKLSKQVEMTVTGEGLRIELLETETGTFFETGSPVPTQAATDLLRVLAGELDKLNNRLFIEGHTDARPYSGNGNYDNWELSADRANAARRSMQSHGLQLHRVTQVRGFADQSLRDRNNPNAASNRRVSIIVQHSVPDSATPAAAPVAAKAPAEPAGKASSAGVR